MAKNSAKLQEHRPFRIRRRWAAAVVVIAGLVLAGAGWLIARTRSPETREAPEAQKVLDVQANMPFQILIPAYLPKAFDRAGLQIDVNQTGPGGEPMVQLTYRTHKDAVLTVRQWVPVNPDKEILAASRPIQTKWGRGWLLKEGEDLAVIWSDIGPLRVSIYTTKLDLLPQEQLLAIAETMGPASNRQVFSFVVNPPRVQEMAPPPPQEIATDAQGVQQVDLIVTPGGYSPVRFAVKAGVPVHLTFRQLGQVGCGSELNFPTGPTHTASLLLQSAADKQELTFTPQQAGEYQFFCSHLMYRGVMTVR